ncbi:MAG: protein-L-isoaspartate(D-aspartate) O-methyltransferase [Spirochaetales bacterium]|nr:protein-L-isoaspartate(D-aspartate) O-methyltransferase [Spirochaetales bacterium]MCF7937904.1 protein-L-isoaspartate(D-aspartate) O-methyltransferase [Spirochaetales bacterium]
MGDSRGPGGETDTQSGKAGQSSEQAGNQDNASPSEAQDSQSGTSDNGEYRDRREHLVQDVLTQKGIQDQTVLEAMMAVRRHEFVPEQRRDSSYVDRSLPIGHGQTISQPYIVAFMTEKLGLEEDDRVLEVGTGSGYQAAVLAKIVKDVYSIEIIEGLHESAEARLRRLGYTNIHLRQGDGYFGWPEQAPFDAVIVTAAAGHIPPPLVEQLKAGGRIIIPIGGTYEVQSLVLVEKHGPEDVTTDHLLPVRFVPMTGQAQKGKAQEKQTSEGKKDSSS